MPMSARQRSKTFRGLAEAMADQWSTDENGVWKASRDAVNARTTPPIDMERLHVS